MGTGASEHQSKGSRDTGGPAQGPTAPLNKNVSAFLDDSAEPWGAQVTLPREAIELVQAEQVREFGNRLQRDTEALGRMVSEDKLERLPRNASGTSRDPEISRDIVRCGLEVEYPAAERESLQPRPETENTIGANAAIIEEAQNTEQLRERRFQLTCEMGKFQLEKCVHPIEPHGQNLRIQEDDLQRDYRMLDLIAGRRNLTVIPASILPTINPQHLNEGYMTAGLLGRYGTASLHARALRGDSWEVRFPGVEGDEVAYEVDTTMSVALGCSLQVHIQPDPDLFVPLYNGLIEDAAMLLAPTVSSALSLQRIGAKESRIPAYEQAWELGRVFLSDYIDDPMEPFIENARDFGFVFTDPATFRQSEQAPELAALALQNGSIHRWVRPVYGVFESQPHLRVEFRPIGISPGMVNNMANTAFVLGRAYWRAMNHDPARARLTQEEKRRNFDAVVLRGLEAWIIPQTGAEPVPFLSCARELCDTAREGLAAVGVDQDVIDRYIGCIEARMGIHPTEILPDWALSSETEEVVGATVADWQIASLRKLCLEGADSKEAMQTITRSMHNYAHQNARVHRWKLAD